MIKALILAAGEGARLRPYTVNRPKPMIPIAGKPILQHNIELLARHGIRELAINLHHCPDVISDHFGDGTRFGVHITYSFEPMLLGTAGALKQIESFFSETFVVIYGDNLIRCDLTRLLNKHQRHAAQVTIALFHRDDVTQSGIVELDGADRITRFLEKPAADQVFSHWVNAGVLVLEPLVLQQIPADVPSDFGREILPRLVRDGAALYGYRMGPHEGLWWIDTPADLEHVQNTFKEASLQ
jgi:NDP-sugar pyrophosphorylase family protein